MPAPYPDQACIRARDRLPVQELAGETFLYDGHRRVIHNLQDLETELWRDIDRPEGATPTGLTALLVERFEVDAARARRDLEAFLEALEAAELITVLPPGTGAEG